jgi:5-(carboxyamino)imidazole ribonucleotide synthase
VRDGDETSTPLVAVLGGGQLGRMLGLAGLPLGVRFRFLDPTPDAPAGAVGPLVVGALGDEDALDETIRDATAVTFEWEGVPADAGRHVERQRPIHPSPRALEVSQDRLLEKALFLALGIDVPRFAAVDDRAELDAAVADLGLPAVLKTRRGGYDGKGQQVLHAEADADRAWSELGGVPLILESLVPFDRELSVIAARGTDGTTSCYPLVQNTHVDGILRVSRAPAPDLTPELQAQGAAIAAQLLDELAYVGVLAVELFEVDGRLLANELAPRVHNSGHWTIEGADTSQFENHVRAVLGWPLGSAGPRGLSAMVNCLGSMPEPARVLAIPGTHLHDYGKAARPGRKVGHVTVTASDEVTLDQRTTQLRAAVPELFD